jgi:asparagine synthase (glutamine-hydrolysing)
MTADLLSQMRDQMFHRGPDGEGIHLGQSIALAHRRLSIVDLEGGAQPMSNSSATVVVSYNGELYNYLTLRDGLIHRGHEFRTRSDTETLLHLYEELGVGCAEAMTGMFAFAVWDERRRRCLLVRDRLGIKPLYFWHRDGVLIFASEIKAILAHPWVTRSLDPGVLREYLAFRYVAGPRTFFRDIQRLLPGHRLIWEGGRVTVERYWNVTAPGARVSDEESYDQLHTLIEECVSSHRMSDVPLGSFCSGGVDSGIVTALLARQAAPEPIHTFSVGFEEPEWDERDDARTVAHASGAIHHELVMDSRQFAKALRRANWHFDEPVSHPNSIPLLLLSDFARSYVTVVLTGEGSDEVFGGYPRYLIARLHERMRGGPRMLRQSLGVLLSQLPLRRVRKLGSGLMLDESDLCVWNSAFVDINVVKKLCPDDATGESLDYRFDQVRHTRSRGFRGLELLMAYEIGTYLPSALDRMDKMSMAASLEARVPFVDHRLIEYGLSMHVQDRIRGTTTKYAIKKIAERYMSREVIYKPKSGFGLPLASWFRQDGPLRNLLERISESSAFDAYVDRSLCERLREEHISGTRDHSEVLWALLNLMLWGDEMLQATAPV